MAVNPTGNGHNATTCQHFPGAGAGIDGRVVGPPKGTSERTPRGRFGPGGTDGADARRR